MKTHLTDTTGPQLDQDTYEALLAGALAARTCGETAVRALLALPDAELGRRLKQEIALYLEVNNPPTSKATLSRPVRAGAGKRMGRGLRALVEDLALAARRQWVEDGELITATALQSGLHLSARALSQAVNARRMFTVRVDATDYFPAFYLCATPARRKLEAVTKSLGDMPGQNKLWFFTSPHESLGGLTPLQALPLLPGRIKFAAADFLAR
ncbi:hypothetical protein METUNv1_01584 [Methyloversatilis universalis FAM5]|uniref:Uncharacterized protein n=1 Tax=Methyloversatilis universalis (strain ATCC BAA-1314 / DSM 25237 / JCM 13912 / CCUG 52030 / FAM5) TaxID=1000565 RepID=F5RBE1_METUF|nr:hypothetical protein [Methyloversatilis universalis]EGK72112.1 hypothetical protein METUNv1_01584 [Methyloversatilis universalis FAM5]